MCSSPTGVKPPPLHGRIPTPKPSPLRCAGDDLVALCVGRDGDNEAVRRVPPVDLGTPQPVQVVVAWMLFSVRVDRLAEEVIVPEGFSKNVGDLRELGEVGFADAGHGCGEGWLVVDGLIGRDV